MLESLNYSFRNPKNILEYSTASKSWEITKKTVGSSEDPSLVNNVDDVVCFLLGHSPASEIDDLSLVY